MSLLRIASAEVWFGGVQALDQVDLEVAPGTITGLIGPNGAGKTTLFNVVCGFQGLSSGTVHLDGRNITKLRPHERVRLGIVRTFQHLETFGSMSVRENILVAAEAKRRGSREGRSPRIETDEILEQLGLGNVAEDRVGSLPTGTARLVEIGRALALKPKLLLLDEASSGLDAQESQALAAILAPIVCEFSILLVEHNIEFVMGLCSQLYVLDFGRMLASGSPGAVQSDPLVQAAYLGVGAA